MSFSDKLKSIRESKGMTQQDLAKATNISQQSISSYEIGTSIPSWINVQKIALVLGVSCTDFADDVLTLSKPKKKKK